MTELSFETKTQQLPPSFETKQNKYQISSSAHTPQKMPWMVSIKNVLKRNRTNVTDLTSQVNRVIAYVVTIYQTVQPATDEHFFPTSGHQRATPTLAGLRVHLRAFSSSLRPQLTLHQ